MEIPLRPEHLHYDFVENHFFHCIHDGQTFLFDPVEFDMELRRLAEKLGFPFQALVSLIRNLSLRHVKKTSPKVRSRLKSFLRDYNKRHISILELSKKANYPPYLFARMMVEAIASIPKKSITDAMRDPKKVLFSLDQIDPEYHPSEQHQQQHRQHPNNNQGESLSLLWSAFPTRLAYEVDQALRADPMHGPMLDKDRHLVGVEYEVVLEHCLRELEIPFETEEDLRDKGTSRTPDVLLTCPIGIPTTNPFTKEEEWKVICWIDSKALFGDVYTHNTSVLPQAESYVHRFGPGLVLYWFGHAPADRLKNANGDIVLAAWQLPTKFMYPSGKIGHKDAKHD